MQSLWSLEIGNLGEKMPKVSSPNRRNSRFLGDDWQRPVRSPLRGRAGSEFAPVLVRLKTRHRGNTGDLARGVAATSALSRLDDPGIPIPGEDSDYQIGFDPAFSRIATARFVHN